ncbi:MAG: hypothetical protein ACXACY_28630 [Candidatus Hodarchaeales archaeon]|jgi:hypothetical protein
MIQPLDGTDVQFYVITDGHPNSPDTALQLAGTFETKVNTIYIGPDEGYSSQKLIPFILGQMKVIVQVVMSFANNFPVLRVAKQ